MNSQLNSLANAKISTHAVHFEALVRRFCMDARSFGHSLVPTYNNFQKFCSLSEQKQIETLNAFSTFYSVLMASHSKGADVHDSQSIMWWAIRELGLRPPSDLFVHLEKGDVVEIYNPDNIQIFRSFNFFDLTSYSVEDVFSYSWIDLYSRSEFITNDMISITGKIMAGETEGVVATDFPLHIVTCKFSPGREWCLIRHKLFASLKSSNNQRFLFNVFKVVERKSAEN